MIIEYRFVQPVDTVTVRGNKLFGDPGSIGEANFPPNPSVLAGAFRSHLLTHAANEIPSFTEGERLADDALHAVLGTIEEPGSFTLASLFPARRTAAGELELFMPLPADVWVMDEGKTISQLEPQAVPAGIKTSQIATLPMVPVLRQDKQAKQESGWLLNEQGMQAYFAGEKLQLSYLQKQEQLWQSESRVGIGLSTASRTADEGRLFTVEHTVPCQIEHEHQNAVGLLLGLGGCGDTLHENGFIHLGGDGRAARFNRVVASLPQASPEKIREQKRFKLILHTPGLFVEGWLPDNIIEKDGRHRLQLEGLSTRLCCAAVSRYEVISGWDLANWRPKVAERAAPAGSVYWFDELEGDVAALDKLVSNGLWPANNDNNAQRRAEGFNRAQLACWT